MKDKIRILEAYFYLFVSWSLDISQAGSNTTKYVTFWVPEIICSEYYIICIKIFILRGYMKT